MNRRLVLIVLALLIAAPAWAQQGTTELRGRVQDAQSGVLPGVTVTVRNQATGMYRETVSGPDGSFIASGLTPGTYEVVAELQGFKKFNRKDLILEVGKTTSIDVKMDVGGIEQTVTVTGESPLIDVTSKEIGGNITSDTLVQLPSVNGNFIGFVGLLPGIVPSISTESFGSDSISVNGQDPRNNNYMLDGGNNNDDVIGQRAGTQARTPIEAVQEFQVLTNQFDAEFGRTAGAVVNAVTKAGSNRTLGTGFGYFQRADMTSKDFFAIEKGLAKPDTKYDRWGGTVGGPIVRDKLHYFGSLERFSIDRPTTVNIPARPEFNGTQVTQDRVWNTIVRGDHQLNSNNTYSVRWLRESSPQTNQIIGAVTPAAAREESDVDQTLSGTVNSVLSSTKVNTLRTTWTRENVAFANHCFNTNGRDLSQCQPTLAFQTFTDQQDNTAQARIDDAIQLDETLAWFLPNHHGDHDIKFGAQYEYTGALNLNQGNLNGTFSFGLSNGPFVQSNPFTYPDRFSIASAARTACEKIHYFAGFAQDKWRVSPKLTVSLGLRYDLESMPIPNNDDPLVTKSPVDKNNFAPRLGLTYDLNGGKSVVRGGYGRFYEREHLELIAGLWNPLFNTSSAQTFPASGPDTNPRNGRLPTDPFLVNGPVINTALLNQMFPAGVPVQSTGPTWDNPDRSNPYTDELTGGYERQPAGALAVLAAFVHPHSRTADDAEPEPESALEPEHQRVHLTRSPALTDARNALLPKYPNLRLQRRRHQFVNTGRIDYDALMMQLRKRFSHNYSLQVSYTYANARGNYSGSGAPGSNFQVGQDMHLELNEGPTDFDIHHNFTVSGTALVPHTYGLNVSWVARALSGLPFSLTNGAIDPDLNGIQAEPIAAGDYTGVGTDPYTVKGYESKRNARAARVSTSTCGSATRIPLREAAPSGSRLMCSTSRTTPTLRPGGQPEHAVDVPGAHRITRATRRKLQIGARIVF